MSNNENTKVKPARPSLIEHAQKAAKRPGKKLTTKDVLIGAPVPLNSKEGK